MTSHLALHWVPHSFRCKAVCDDGGEDGEQHAQACRYQVRRKGVSALARGESRRQGYLEPWREAQGRAEGEGLGLASQTAMQPTTLTMNI